MRAAIYARVSTKQQAEKEASIPEQIKLCKELGIRLGATEFVEYVDDGYSGADPARPAMRKLLADAGEGKFDFVICYSVDRWARDLVDQLVFAREVERYAKLEFVTDRTGDSPEDRLFFQIRGGFAEYERALIRARTMMGRRKKAEKGKIVIPGTPYGYRYNMDKDNPAFYVFEPEAEVVRQMYRWVVEEGLGIGAVAVRLTEMGIPSPKGSQRWSNSTVGRILHNEVYKGEFYNYKWKIVSDGGRRKYVRRDSNERLLASVPPIVSKELWDRAQRAIQRNGIKTKSGRKNRYLLAGHIRCGICGRAWYTTPQGSKLYYRCAGTLRTVVVGTNSRCPSSMLSAGPLHRFGWPGLDAVVWERVAETLRDPDRLIEEWNRQFADGQQAKKLKELRERLDQFRKRLSDLEKQKDELLDLRLEGFIDHEGLKMRLGAIERRRQSIIQDVEALETQIRAYERRQMSPELVRAFCEKIANDIDNLSFEQKRELLRLLDVVVTVYPDRIEITLPVPGGGPEPNNMVPLPATHVDGFSSRSSSMKRAHGGERLQPVLSSKNLDKPGVTAISAIRSHVRRGGPARPGRAGSPRTGTGGDPQRRV